MDINSAEKSIKKLLAYAQDLAESKPRMYQKSRDRLKELADTCMEVVTVISSVIQDEALAEDIVEFNSEPMPNIANAIQSMQAQLDQLRSFAGVSSESTSSSNSTSNTFTNSKKGALRKYTDVLQSIATVDFKYDYVSRCAKFLWYWFDVRFRQTVRTSGFRYNMKKFPVWVRDIVLMYGKAIRDNTYLDLDKNVRSWVDGLLAESDSPNLYSIPYDLYQFERDMCADDMTMEAAVLWDILLDNGLSELCTHTSDDLFLSEGAVYDLCSELNPSVLDSYTDYASHPEVFTTLGWEVRKHA